MFSYLNAIIMVINMDGDMGLYCEDVLLFALPLHITYIILGYRLCECGNI